MSFRARWFRLLIGGRAAAIAAIACSGMLTAPPGLAQSVPEPPAANDAADSSSATALSGQGERAKAAVSRVEAPVALAVPVDYPTGAEGAAVVVLQLVVGTDGLVREPQVIVGDEPFATAAISAIGRWRFTPARRGDRRVAAKIQFEVRFEQRPGPSAPESSAKAPEDGPAPLGSPEGSAAAAIQTSVEVVVEGDRPPATVSFSR
ncbi:MAG: hypothetical protein RJA70_3742, partial [Pseudomonadota bacterium]